MADITVTAANVVKSTGATTGRGTAGATITAGQTLYKDTTDSSSLKLADADDSQATALVAGISLHGASSGQPIEYQTGGQINPGGTVAIGTRYFASGNAGGIAPFGDLAQNDWVSQIGVGISSSIIDMGIDNSGVQVP